ncbi:hypothetical protein Hanom_Chr00s000562g01649471 [Helianthus anomalus]
MDNEGWIREREVLCVWVYYADKKERRKAFLFRCMFFIRHGFIDFKCINF